MVINYTKNTFFQMLKEVFNYYFFYKLVINDVSTF